MMEKKYVIQDNIHGRIWITELEKKIIDTETFQRLRRIRQLGLVDYVFPSATHSRFSHSLGVLHLMGLMTEQPYIREEIEDKRSKTEVDEIITLLRLAALLHDIGHYPFSHLTEQVYEKVTSASNEASRSMVEPGDKTFAGFWDRPILDRAALPPKRNEAHHENLAEQVITKRNDIAGILQDNRTDIELLFNIIKGNIPLTDTEGSLTTLYINMLNSDFDCDRLDYLLRDSAAAGVGYGQIDLMYLIENLRIGMFQTDDGPRKCLAIDKKHGLHALEHYVLARYFMYMQIVYHKAVQSMELIYQAILLMLVESSYDYIYRSLDDILNIIDKREFLDFDDSYILNAMRHAYANSSNGKLVMYMDRFFSRQHLKTAKEDRKLSETVSTSIMDLFTTIPNLKALLAEKAGIDIEDFTFKQTDVKTTTLAGYIPAGESLDPAFKEANIKLYAKSAKLIEKDKSLKLLSEEKNSALFHIASQNMRITRAFVIDDEDKEVPNSPRKRLEAAIDSF